MQKKLVVKKITPTCTHNRPHHSHNTCHTTHAEHATTCIHTREPLKQATNAKQTIHPSKKSQFTKKTVHNLICKQNRSQYAYKIVHSMQAKELTSCAHNNLTYIVFSLSFFLLSCQWPRFRAVFGVRLHSFLALCL